MDRRDHTFIFKLGVRREGLRRLLFLRWGNLISQKGPFQIDRDIILFL